MDHRNFETQLLVLGFLLNDNLHDPLHLVDVHLPGVVLVVHLEGPPQLVVRSPGGETQCE